MVIVFGNITGKELLVAASVVGPTLIGAFGIIRLLTNFMVLIKDMDEKNWDWVMGINLWTDSFDCLLYTSPSPRDQRGWGMPAYA